MHSLRLVVVPGSFAVCRLAPDSEMPKWLASDGFFSVTRTAEELSIVCADDARIPNDIRCERGWRMLRLAGTQPFSATGILSSILAPLAQAEIGIFAVSTFDTDYVLLKSESFERALGVLRSAGHEIAQN